MSRVSTGCHEREFDPSGASSFRRPTDTFLGNILLLPLHSYCGLHGRPDGHCQGLNQFQTTFPVGDVFLGPIHATT